MSIAQRTGKGKVGNFWRDLAASKEYTQLVFDTLNRKYGPCEIVVNNIKGNDKGIDLVIKRVGMSDINIDVKERKIDYGDILLEEYSNGTKKTPGWTWDNSKETDVIVYVTPNNIYLIDALGLRNLWNLDYRSWKSRYQVDRFGHPTSKFDGKTYDDCGNLLYRTPNIPVPICELSSVIIN